MATTGNRKAKPAAPRRRASSGEGVGRAEGATARTPVAPYLAVGISTVVYGVGERKHIERKLQTIEDAIHAAMGVISSPE